MTTDEAAAELSVEVMSHSCHRATILLKRKGFHNRMEQVLVVCFNEHTKSPYLEFVDAHATHSNPVLTWHLEIVHTTVYDSSISNCCDIEFTVCRLRFDIGHSCFYLAMSPSQHGALDGYCLINECDVTDHNSLWIFEPASCQSDLPRVPWWQKCSLAVADKWACSCGTGLMSK
jgi:hypothetical protein